MCIRDSTTSGFFLMMPKREVVELDMTVDEALRKAHGAITGALAADLLDLSLIHI